MIVTGGAGGLSAALTLGRARRRALVIAEEHGIRPTFPPREVPVVTWGGRSFPAPTGADGLCDPGAT